MKELNIHEKLNIVQTSMKVEKGHKNNFGNYNYRNLADIFEAVKPYLAETSCTLVVTDEMVEVGGSNYIKATAVFADHEGNEIAAYGWARESVTKKGMDDSQITGAASSYARKYACNGLFAIDDTADADSMDNRDHLSQLRANTKGEVIVRTDSMVKLKRLSNSVHFKGAKTKKGLTIEAGVEQWLRELIAEGLSEERTEDKVMEKYIKLKDLEIGFKEEQENKKEAA